MPIDKYVKNPLSDANGISLGLAHSLQSFN